MILIHWNSQFNAYLSPNRIYYILFNQDELELMLNSESMLENIDTTYFESNFDECDQIEMLKREFQPIKTSDNYIETLRHFLIEKYGPLLDEKQEKIHKSDDFLVIDMKFAHDINFKFAKVYGFRNLQILTQKIKRNTCDFDFIEAMACPKGCTNGGAQLKQTQSDKMIEDFLPFEILPNNLNQTSEMSKYPNLVTTAVQKSLNVLDW